MQEEDDKLDTKESRSDGDKDKAASNISRYVISGSIYNSKILLLSDFDKFYTHKFTLSQSSMLVT